jgi:hypothetical protein
MLRRSMMRPIMEKYRAGDRAAAVDGYFSVVLGPDWRAEVSRTVPGGPEQADTDAATLFESGAGAVLRRRRCSEDHAAGAPGLRS